MEKIIHESVAKLLQLDFVVGCIKHDWDFNQNVVQITFTKIEDFNLKAILTVVPVEHIFSVRIMPGTKTAFIYLNLL